MRLRPNFLNCLSKNVIEFIQKNIKVLKNRYADLKMRLRVFNQY